MLNRLGNLSMSGTFLIRSLPLVIIADNSPNLYNISFFPDRQNFSVTDGSIWIQYLFRYSEIFQKLNFHVVRWKSTFV